MHLKLKENEFRSLHQVTSYTDLCRIFYQVQDAELWAKISANMPDSDELLTFTNQLLIKQNRLMEANQAELLNLVLKDDQDILPDRLRFAYSDAIQINQVLLAWRNFISIVASILTQINLSIPIDSSVPEAEFLVGGNLESKLFNLDELYEYATNLV